MWRDCVGGVCTYLKVVGPIESAVFGQVVAQQITHGTGIAAGAAIFNANFGVAVLELGAVQLAVARVDGNGWQRCGDSGCYGYCGSSQFVRRVVVHR